MTYTLEKAFRFEASHKLPYHDGKCRRLHGHSWVGKAIVQGDALLEGVKSGMLVDFGDLSAAINPIVEQHLDHWHLNDSTGLHSPTSENLAKWIFDKLLPAVPQLVAVRIEETCTSAAEYRKEERRI